MMKRVARNSRGIAIVQKRDGNIKQSYRTGLGFGTVSGVITTLGLIMGLDAGTHSTAAVLGGIITIAIADALSDALGIHVSEESSKDTTERSVWESTLATFATKLIIALTFAVPVLLLPLDTAVIASVAWGMLLLGALSVYIARLKKENAYNVLAEHWGIAVLVLLVTYLVGTYVVSPMVGAA
ncbi:MAG: hypothetical protein QXS93_01655 [Candidatus Micrarchaeia archaeon]